MKILKKIKNESKIHYAIIIIISLIVSIPLLKLQLGLTDDGKIHMLRIIGLDRIIGLGEFPQYIMPDYCRDFGYAINLFYAPLVTYIPLAFKIIAMNYYNALKLFAMATICISGFTMYTAAKGITKRTDIALLASVIYIVFPYKLETIYNRFAIGEFSAYMFMPLIYYGIYNVINEDGKKNYLLIFGAVALFLTHTITTEYMAFFVIIYILFNIKELKNKRIIKQLVLDIGIILGMVAFFIVPMIEHRLSTEYTIFDSSEMNINGNYVQSETINISQLFRDEEENGISFKIGIPIIVGILIGLISFKKIDKELKSQYVLWTFFATISIIMCSKFFIWRIMPEFFCTLQFPWRLIAFFGLYISLVCATNISTIMDRITNLKAKNITLILSIVLIVIVSIPLVNRYNDFYGNGNEDLIYEKNILQNLQISPWKINREYLPSKAGNLEQTYLVTRENKVYVLDGSAIIQNENKNNLNLDFEIYNAKENSILELPYIYYLGYEAKISVKDECIKLKTFESDNGFVAIKLPKDIKKATVSIEYKGTTIEKISNIISICTLCGYGLYLVFKKIKTGEKIESK